MQILITRVEVFQKLLNNQNSTDNIIHLENTKLAQQRYKIYKFDQYLKAPVALDKFIIPDDLIKYRKAEIIKLLNNNPNIKHIKICSVEVTQEEAIFVLQNLKEGEKVKEDLVRKLLELYKFDQYPEAHIEFERLIILDNLIKHKKTEIIKFLSNNNINVKHIEICYVEVTQEQARFVLQNLKEGETANGYIIKNLVKVYNCEKYLKALVALDKLMIFDDLIKYKKAEVIKLLNNNPNIKHIEICSVEVTQEQARFVLEILEEDDSVFKNVVEGLMTVYNFDQYLKAPVALDKLIISYYLVRYRKAEIVKFLSTNNVNIKDIEIRFVKVTQEEAKFVLQNLKERQIVYDYTVEILVELYKFDQYLKATIEPAKLEISNNLIKQRKAEIIKFLSTNNVNIKDIEICSVKVTQEEAKLILQNLKENETVNKYIVEELVVLIDI